MNGAQLHALPVEQPVPFIPLGGATLDLRHLAGSWAFLKNRALDQWYRTLQEGAHDI